jgi:GTP pyrophosphokinase
MASQEELVGLLNNPSEKEAALIRKAYEFSEKAHEGQTRFTGDPYFTHTYEVAKILAELKLDTPTIIAGLLHDTIEDANVPPETISKEFGKDVLFLVEGVTKLGTLKYRGAERHVESLRKLFIATAKDARVLIIKLADRLHNMRTLYGHTRPDKQLRIALETLEIYAPLAHRLGIGKIQGELEDYAFQYVFPKEYAETKELAKERKHLNEQYLEKVRRALQKALAKEGIVNAHIDYRAKRIYSLYKKLKRYEMEIEKVYDIVALRVIVPTVADCYRVLGIIHGLWTPLPGRIKDYIALPKPNGYKSLHTTIFTGDGGIIEIQVRTTRMHEEAEYGIASHFAYKEGFFAAFRTKQAINKQMTWMKSLLEWQKNIQESGEFLENLKMEFFEDRVFVFTPKGDVIDLPAGATGIDFAYLIHSDVGDHMSGVKINGKMKSLDTALQSGDIIEIITKKSSQPTTKWLDYAKTSLARKHIRATLQQVTPQSNTTK